MNWPAFLILLPCIWALCWCCHEHGRIAGMRQGARREREAAHLRATKINRQQWQG